MGSTVKTEKNNLYQYLFKASMISHGLDQQKIMHLHLFWLFLYLMVSNTCWFQLSLCCFSLVYMIINLICSCFWSINWRYHTHSLVPASQRAGQSFFFLVLMIINWIIWICLEFGQKLIDNENNCKLQLWWCRDILFWWSSHKTLSLSL